MRVYKSGITNIPRPDNRDFLKEAAKELGQSVYKQVSAQEINALAAEKQAAANEKWAQTVAQFSAYASVYEITDRILASQDVRVTATNNPQLSAPARNNGLDIEFNFAAIDAQFNSDEFIVSLHGLNHHEVAHLLWTPRAGSALMKWCVENRYMQAFNILEDNRIESMLVAKYPSAANFLSISAAKHILEKVKFKHDEALLFPLLCGRPYLPVELRQQLAVLFTSLTGDADLTRRIQSVVDEYRTLALPTDEKRAKQLIQTFATLLFLSDPAPEFDPDKPSWEQGGSKTETHSPSFTSKQHNCADREPMKMGRPESGKKQEQVHDMATPTDQIDTSDESLTNNAAGDADADADADSNGKTAGKTVGELAQELLDKAEQSADTRREVKAKRDAVRSTQRAGHTLGRIHGTPMPVTGEMRSIASAFGNELIRAEIDADPAWERETPSGRLNIQRAMHGDVNDINSLFDRWTFGDQTNEIEAVIMIDNSGSMAGQMQATNQAAWIIKRAIEQIQGSVSTLTFSTESKRLYDSKERAEPTTYRHVPPQNSTNPIGALMESTLIMEASNKPNKLVIILTDGAWDDFRNADALITELREKYGSLVVVCYLSENGRWDTETQTYVRTRITPKSDEYKYMHHGADLFRHIFTPKELVDVARDVVTTVIKNNAAK